jgi:predicted MFS family arabinose efflux permease
LEVGRCGTALAYFSVAFAVGIILGASGGGLLYPLLGFHGLLGLGALMCGCGILALLRDRFRMPLAAPVETSRRYAGQD